MRGGTRDDKSLRDLTDDDEVEVVKDVNLVVEYC